MRPLSISLCVCLGLALSSAAPSHTVGAVEDSVHPPKHDGGGAHHQAEIDRCDGIEFDAIAPDEKGTTFFFKGDHLWKGFYGPAQLSNASFRELDDYHHPSHHVDAAFRMHNKDDPEGHDHIFLFLDDKVFSYYNHTLEKGFPTEIEKLFPGIPSHLDAAVECPKGECVTDSVLFFKGNYVYSYDIATKQVKKKEWAHLPKCTSAFRWLEHHFCFHGHNFTRFHPVTGEMVGASSKDTRDYFMKCSGFGHGAGHKLKPCNETHLDAVTSDNEGKTYYFIGNLYIRVDTHRDGQHTFPIRRSWKEITNGVDAAFSLNENLYMIKDDKVFIYKSAAHYTLIEGYPKTLKEELGVDGPVDAAFVCDDQPVLHIIQGNKMLFIDLSATPRAVSKEIPLHFPRVDAALCGPDGVKVFVGSEYFLYQSPMILAVSKINPVPMKIPPKTLACEV